jgi:hypothetical protein
MKLKPEVIPPLLSKYFMKNLHVLKFLISVLFFKNVIEKCQERPKTGEKE